MLKGGQIYLRTLEPSDADIIWKWENNADNWRVSNTLVPFSRKLIEDYVNSAQDIYSIKQLRFIICLVENDKEIGAIDLFDFDPYHHKVGLGILIAELQDRRNGYAKEAVLLIKEYCFSHLNLHQVYCNILSENKASIDLFEKSGFTVCGTKKDWIKNKEGWLDELMLQSFSI
ncbi:GNAT family N-acetyltransferase [Flavobacteriales bacterium]|nr:GNAT family N-acetyltransferase [Flavobacteriales bacterium]